MSGNFQDILVLSLALRSSLYHEKWWARLIEKKGTDGKDPSFLME
jgi:hypothetical protein